MNSRTPRSARAHFRRERQRAGGFWESAESEGLSNQSGELVRDGGSADSASICCSRNRLPLSDIARASFLMKFGPALPVSKTRVYLPGFSCKAFFRNYSYEST